MYSKESVNFITKGLGSTVTNKCKEKGYKNTCKYKTVKTAGLFDKETGR
jgi:hypothetical protein